MRFVVVSDVHGNVGKAERLVERLMGEEFDALLIAGDITHFRGRESAEKVLNAFEELGKPMLAIMGNCDGRDVLDLLEERGISVHDRRVELGGVGIVGFGGSNITPFSTIWEFDDGAILESLSRNYRDGDVLLLHTPPYGTKADRIYSGRHVGSKGVRDFIKERQPPLVLCGHIHEARAVDSIGKTVVVNPGPLFRGYYATVELKGGKVSVSLERL
ncbi:metallophosphoesterase [Palaeococcus ferrophilus]|uniref:metallophosphoesterase n=1 Tax=Palaeococcus ferrophilus TaxID=83868 RepID=UPI00064ECBA1|nr:metallophosphoesterase [Palaeococcus ferrophilus]